MRERIRELIDEALESVRRLDDAHAASLESAARLLIDCFGRGGAVLVCGNGGSAADAQHIAGELVGRYRKERAALNCIALTANSSNLTAIANDYAYDRVFARQVEAHLRAGDVLWAISTSGTSPSVVTAAEGARSRGGKVLAFTGQSGGKLADSSDVCFRAPATATYAVQQIHQIGYHVVCELVEQAMSRR